MGTLDLKDLLAQITRAIVSLSGLGGITFLASRGRVDPAATVAIYSTVLSLYGAATLRHAQNITNGRNGGPSVEVNVPPPAPSEEQK
jgi:hypothetical protein